MQRDVEEQDMDGVSSAERAKARARATAASKAKARAALKQEKAVS